MQRGVSSVRRLAGAGDGGTTAGVLSVCLSRSTLNARLHQAPPVRGGSPSDIAGTRASHAASNTSDGYSSVKNLCRAVAPAAAATSMAASVPVASVFRRAFATIVSSSSCSSQQQDRHPPASSYSLSSSSGDSAHLGHNAPGVRGVEAVYLGIGSNLGNAASNIQAAVRRLNSLPDTRVQCTSFLYRTEPCYVVAQPAFVNAVIRLDTGLSPMALLAACKVLRVLSLPPSLRKCATSCGLMLLLVFFCEPCVPESPPCGPPMVDSSSESIGRNFPS